MGFRYFRVLSSGFFGFGVSWLQGFDAPRDLQNTLNPNPPTKALDLPFPHEPKISNLESPQVLAMDTMRGLQSQALRAC